LGESPGRGAREGGRESLAEARRVVSCIEEEVRELQREEKEWRNVLAEMKDLQARQEREYRRVEDAMARTGV